MPFFQLKPACKDYLWGGHSRLREHFGVESDLKPLAEAWVLSCHPDGPSVLADGPDQGKTLPEYLQAAGKEVLGTNCRDFENFPLLIKFIDAEKDLSVQVHPSDEYALAHEGQYGKTEMWVALEASPGACLYYGFRREVTREEYAAHIKAGTLTDLLRRVPVRKGDVYFIPAGTLHAIGAGVVIAEIQQNSNVTYRVFDYNRVGADGKPRPLHVEKALEVTDLRPTEPPSFAPHLGICPCFAADQFDAPFSGLCGPDSFHALLVTEGEGTLTCEGTARRLQRGGCWFLTAGSGEYQVEGNCRFLTVRVPDSGVVPFGEMWYTL